jgi:phosphotransferase system enzyme I (PtsI)
MRNRERQLRILLPPEPSDPRSSRVTRDGRRILLSGNAATQREVDAAARVDADGIGLYRTEMLYLSRDRLPTEVELTKAYSEAACSFVREPVDIRLLDLGSDKHLPGARWPRESNPALGLRSLRFLFQHPEMLKVQLRAIYQAGADGPVRALLPMVAGPQDLDRVREIAAECHEELRRQGIRHDPDLAIGAMIEHPAAVVMAPEILHSADFVSVGTNDLTMYVLAADRDASHRAPWYDACHPAIIRILRELTRLGAAAGKPVSVCGEIAADPTFTGLLVGLGVERLSMAPQWILPVGQVVGAMDGTAWKEVADLAAAQSSPEGVRRTVRDAQRVLAPDPTS